MDTVSRCVFIKIENERVQALYKDDRVSGNLRPPRGFLGVYIVLLSVALFVVSHVYHTICVNSEHPGAANINNDRIKILKLSDNLPSLS